MFETGGAVEDDFADDGAVVGVYDCDEWIGAFIGICHDDDPGSRVVRELIGSLLGPSGDVEDDFVAEEIDDFDGAVAVAGVELVAVRQDNDPVRAGGRGCDCAVG